MSRFVRDPRRGLVLAAVGALVAAFAFPPVGFADLAGGCDFAPTGSTPACLGPLANSTFAGGDGNLLTSPTTFGRPTGRTRRIESPVSIRPVAVRTTLSDRGPKKTTPTSQ